MMRSPEALLRYEASKKPLVADALARCHTLTDAEIDALPLPKWLRVALRAERASRERQSVAEKTETALQGHIVDGTVPDPWGVVMRYTGSDSFLRFGTGQVEVKRDRLLLLLDQGGVWFETVYSAKLDERIAALSVIVIRASKSLYTDLYRAELAKRLGSVATANPTLPEHAGHLAALGVRFSHPS